MVKARLLFFAILIGTGSIPNAAEAYGSTRGAITALRIDLGNNRVYVKLANATGGSPPACATGTEYTGVLLITNATSEAAVSLLISARQTGALVNIRGADTCTVTTTFEDISYVVVQEGT